MGFDVQLVMTGLGVIWLRSEQPRNPQPDGIDFLMVACNHGHSHEPRLAFRFEDLAAPDNLELPMHVGSTGATLAAFDLTGRSVQIEAEGEGSEFSVVWCADENATRPGPDAPVDAFDWIPNFERQLGLDNVVGPTGQGASAIYAVQVELPAGRLASARLFPKQGSETPGDWQEWSFGATAPRVLAEQAVLSRAGVERLIVRIDDQELVFDDRAKLRTGHGGPLSIALTNLPPVGLTGRYLSPEHFPMYRSVNDPPEEPWPVRRADGAPEPATTGGACPPGGGGGP
jgi:hypothetical protein